MVFREGFKMPELPDRPELRQPSAAPDRMATRFPESALSRTVEITPCRRARARMRYAVCVGASHANTTHLFDRHTHPFGLQ